MKKLYGIVEVEGVRKDILLAEIEWGVGAGGSTTPHIPIKREEDDHDVFLLGFSYVDFDEYVALFEVYTDDGNTHGFFTDFSCLCDKDVKEAFIYPLSKDVRYDNNWFSERVEHLDDLWCIVRIVAKDDATGKLVLRLGRDLMQETNLNQYGKFVVEGWLTDGEADKAIDKWTKELHIPAFDCATEDWVGNEEEFAKELKQNKDDMLKAMTEVETALFNLRCAWDDYNLDELHDNSKYPFSKDLSEQIGDVGEWISDIEKQMNTK